jgi:hypothetical protein
MDHESDAVPSSVGEILLKASLKEHFSTRSVDLGHLNTWSTRLDPSLLCRSNCLVPIGLFRTHGANNKRSGHIRVVASD